MKKVLITGATDGIGKALVKELYNDYELIICGRDSQKMKLIVDAYPNVYSKCFDITDGEELNTFLNEVKDKFISVDIIINNAGANVRKSNVSNIDINEFRYMFELNCVSGLTIIQEFIDDMIKKRKGHIINVLSSCCLFNAKSVAGYTASKKAMEAISKILTKEVKNYDVKVTSIYPGGVDSNFRTNNRPDYLRPETIAKTIHNCISVYDGTIQELVIRPHIEDNY